MADLSKYKPGDVAVITVAEGDLLALRDVSNPGWNTGAGDGYYDDDEVSAAHPVVVVDPENYNEVKTLRDAMNWGTTNDWQRALRRLVSIKPPEPNGLGAVVKTIDGARWVRGSSARGLKAWSSDDALDSEWRSYADIEASEILSKGVPV